MLAQASRSAFLECRHGTLSSLMSRISYNTTISFTFTLMFLRPSLMQRHYYAASHRGLLPLLPVDFLHYISDDFLIESRTGHHTSYEHRYVAVAAAFVLLGAPRSMAGK